MVHGFLLCGKAVQKRISKRTFITVGKWTDLLYCMYNQTDWAESVSGNKLLFKITFFLNQRLILILILIQGNESQICMFFITTRPSVATGTVTPYILVFKKSISCICAMKVWAPNWVNRLSLLLFLLEKSLLIPAGWMCLTRSLKFDFYPHRKASENTLVPCARSPLPPSVVLVYF